MLPLLLLEVEPLLELLDNRLLFVLLLVELERLVELDWLRLIERLVLPDEMVDMILWQIGPALIGYSLSSL